MEERRRRWRCDGGEKRRRRHDSEKRRSRYGSALVRRRCGHNDETETCEKTDWSGEHW
ncbi:hypothetical protein F2Q68_00012217 [Brassica cretica]|uniref:Uncharacterized protein n=1 Tax=Brassica cretica TaxID=69181 RepID=A0A3N6S3G9_BRACR|nr:hypothetical protein F2Q68_00012217 [Brassica cretica]KAF3535977.1 hypothetical protein F2Q69_00024971 [Brassica cretica]